MRYRLHTKDHFGNPNGINILEIQLKTIHYKFCNQNTIYISICMTTWTQNYNPTSLWKQKAWAFFPRANRFVWMVFLLIARSYELANYDLRMMFDIGSLEQIIYFVNTDSLNLYDAIYVNIIIFLPCAVVPLVFTQRRV